MRDAVKRKRRMFVGSFLYRDYLEINVEVASTVFSWEKARS
jgi:hypothetical protein